jgi:hypothetical protein
MGTGLDVVGRHDGGGAAHRPGGVHPQQRLAHGADGVGQGVLGDHDALEEVGGLADDDGVDVGHRHVGVLERPNTASRSSPGSDTSPRVAAYLVCPVPTTATLFEPIRRSPRLVGCTGSFSCTGLLAVEHRHQVVLHQVSAGGVRDAPVDRAVEDAVGHLADADHPGGHHRVGGQRPTGRVDVHVVGQAHLVAQDRLVVGEAGVQLGHVDRAVTDAGAPRRPAWPTGHG